METLRNRVIGPSEDRVIRASWSFGLSQGDLPFIGWLPQSSSGAGSSPAAPSRGSGSGFGMTQLLCALCALCGNKLLARTTASKILAMHPLDNPTWAALTTYQSDVALIAPQARRFPPEMTVHGAFAEPTAEAWNDLRGLADAPVSLFSTSKPELPSGWTVTRAVELHLMICEQGGSASKELAIAELGDSDLPQMESLYEATRPGRKLSPRLIELGGFVGIKDAGRVVAMACLRLHFPGYHEISTVATLSGHTGRGYATALVGELVRLIRSAGETPYLTVRTDNERAIGIYRRLGFRERNVVHSTTVRTMR